jgi:hypothetical protein
MTLTVWTKHLPEHEREQFNNYLRQSRPIFERLRDILKEQEQRTDELETSIKAYDNPNWSHKQAHRNGSKEMMRQVQMLINPDQWSTN